VLRFGRVRLSRPHSPRDSHAGKRPPPRRRGSAVPARRAAAGGRPAPWQPASPREGGTVTSGQLTYCRVGLRASKLLSASGGCFMSDFDPANFAAVEPAAFAAYGKSASKDQLEARLAGEHRKAILDEIFDRFPKQFRADRAGATNAVIHWTVTGGG